MRPRKPVNTINTVVDYFPYGKVLREFVNGDKERYLTTQHERDQETELDYRGARYYDGDVGRFLSLDPLATEFPGWSDYNYVLGNPIMFIDPDGKAPDGHIYVYNITTDENGNQTKTESHVYTDDSDTDKREYRYFNGEGDVANTTIQEIGEMQPINSDFGGRSYAIENNTNNESSSNAADQGDGGVNWIGPGMIAAGQPIKALKPVGALGSAPGSSIASTTLRKVLPMKAPFRVLGTRVVGGMAGRAVPIVGWVYTIGDGFWSMHGRYIYDNVVNGTPLPEGMGCAVGQGSACNETCSYCVNQNSSDDTMSFP